MQRFAAYKRNDFAGGAVSKVSVFHHGVQIIILKFLTNIVFLEHNKNFGVYR
jgi:hypothetical protein